MPHPTLELKKATRHPPAGGRTSRVLAVGLCALAFFACPLRAQVSKEYQLKAAFLYNFTKFVEWPEARFSDVNVPIVIGVLGRNPFGEELENIVKGRAVNGRPIIVKLVRQPDQAQSVHVLYVPVGEEKLLSGAAATVKASSVLTVGESEAFAALGGVITFTMDVDKVRFEINRIVAEQSGLKISAQLLKLATVVRR